MESNFLPEEVDRHLSAFKQGQLSACETYKAIKKLHLQEDFVLKDTFKIDLLRQQRTGIEEVVFGLGKTDDQIIAVVKALLARKKKRFLITKTKKRVWEKLEAKKPGFFFYDTTAKLIYTKEKEDFHSEKVAVATAGTSDIAIGEETSLTLQFFGFAVERFYDIGVSGISRLFFYLEQLKKFRIVVVVAGMDGVLPSVMAGLVKGVVIAVPTSIGYGTHFGGLSALLAMLNSCSPGVVVVNVDNGFGAAAACKKILGE